MYAMENEIMHQIIEVENAVQKRLDTEKEKSREWIAKIKKEAEEIFQKEEERYKIIFDEYVEDAKKEARKKATEMVNDANINAVRLVKFSDDKLKSIVRKHLKKMLVGG